MNVGTTMHMCISVRGMLKWDKRQQSRAAKSFLVEGRPCRSRDEMVDALLSLLAQGIEVLPLGAACEGFDKVHGCPGHPKRTEEREPLKDITGCDA